MRTYLDNYLGIHPQALTLEAKRNDLLAANLANVDTPNYKARDIDFKAALSAASQSSDATAAGNGAGTSSGAGLIAGAAAPLALRTGNASAAAAPASSSQGGEDAALDPASLKYRVPMAPALDGNTVDEQLEQAAFAENGVRYQASLTFLNTALRNLMTAIVGQ